MAGSTENPIQQALSGEQAGLDILAADGIGPKQDIHKLIQDVTKELRILDFTAGVMTPAATVAKLQIEQGVMSAYVHDTPALVALMPDHTGW